MTSYYHMHVEKREEKLQKVCEQSQASDFCFCWDNAAVGTIASDARIVAGIVGSIASHAV